MAGGGSGGRVEARCERSGNVLAVSSSCFSSPFCWVCGRLTPKAHILTFLFFVGIYIYIYVEWSEKVQEPLAKKQGGGGGLFNPSDSSASFGSAELRMQALPSHSCYMKSEDVAAFVQSKTTLLAVAKAANSSLAKTLT